MIRDVHSVSRIWTFSIPDAGSRGKKTGSRIAAQFRLNVRLTRYGTAALLELNENYTIFVPYSYNRLPDLFFFSLIHESDYR